MGRHWPARRKRPGYWGVLNTKAWEFWKSAGAEERKRPSPLMVDLTQGVQFKSAGTTLGTLLQKSTIYSYELDYVLKATDIFALVRVDKKGRSVWMVCGVVAIAYCFILHFDNAKLCLQKVDPGVCALCLSVKVHVTCQL